MKPLRCMLWPLKLTKTLTCLCKSSLTFCSRMTKTLKSTWRAFLQLTKAKSKNLSTVLEAQLVQEQLTCRNLLLKTLRSFVWGTSGVPFYNLTCKISRKTCSAWTQTSLTRLILVIWWRCLIGEWEPPRLCNNKRKNCTNTSWCSRTNIQARLSIATWLLTSEDSTTIWRPMTALCPNQPTVFQAEGDLTSVLSCKRTSFKMTFSCLTLSKSQPTN